MSDIEGIISTEEFAQKMAQQNDLFRKSFFLEFTEPTIPQGRTVYTRGISERGPEFLNKLLQKLITYDEGETIKAYEVLHETLYEGWTNTWTITDEDGNETPQTFTTEQEAQAELDEFLADIAKEIASGERDEDQGYSCDEFQIVPIMSSEDGFTPDCDPNGWHDMGVLNVEGSIVWFKIDYYDLTYETGVEDPSDLASTRRVMTLMLPDEY